MAEKKNTARQAIIISQPHHPPDPLENASVWAQCCFYWAYPLLKLGSVRPIQDEDLPTLNHAETSAENRRIIEELWAGEIKSGRRNLARAILWDYIRTTWDAQIYLTINMAARIGQAIALGMLMEQFRVQEESNNNNGHDSSGNNDDFNGDSILSKSKKGYMYAAIMVMCGFVAFPSKQHQFFRTYRKGLQTKLGVVAAIYAKTLRLPSLGGGNNGNSQVTSGHVTNLASNDVERFAMTSVSIIFLIQGPFIAIAILIVGIYIIGPVFAFGYVLLFLILPLQVYLSRRFVYFRSKIASITDIRMGILSQSINGARVMKMNNWEHEFYQRVSKLRSEEINVIQTASRYKALNEAIYFFSAPVVSVFIFAIHVVLGGVLTPKNIYTTLTLMSIVQSILTKHVPNAVMGLSECLVSCRRVQSFLELPESQKLLADGSNETCYHDIATLCVRDIGQNNDENENVISLENVTCHWQSSNLSASSSSSSSQKITSTTHIGQDTDESTKQLKRPTVNVTASLNKSTSSNVEAISNVSYQFKKKQIFCIIGKVGSGKSALLQALAGELSVSKGVLENNSKKSLSYAAQEPWIMDGSVRENISMGLPYEEEWYNQVVRACGLVLDIAGFQHGDLTVVGDRGVQCSGGQKARIALARCLYIKDTDVILLDDPLSAVDSKVARTIYYDAILDLAVRRMEKCVILVTHQHQFVGNSTCIFMDNGKIRASGSFGDCVEASNGDISDALQVEIPREQDTTTENVKEEDPSSHPENPQIEQTSAQENIEDKTQNESRTVGSISRATWLAFGKELGGVAICLVFVFIFAITQGAMLVTIVELGLWAEDEAAKQNSPKWFILILSLTGSVVILSILRAIVSFNLFIKASQRLHDRMLRSVLMTKIEFFDTNPLGRILNRFSADVGIVDETFPLTVYDFLVGVFVVLGGIITAGVVLPFILVCVIPLLWAFIMLRKTFVSTGRELKRIEGINRSPIFVTLSETLGGIATIRSNGKISYFKEKFESFQNSHTRAYFAFISTSRWFAFQLDVLSFTLLAFASFLAVLFHDRQWFSVDPAVLGLALTLLIQISTNNFPWIVRQSAEVVNQMVSVERILDFGKLESELYGKNDCGDKANVNWPIDGSIVVDNLTTRYRSNLPVVLSGVTFRVESGQKIGVVGRSGCGKSTLIQAIFRLLEAEEGKIFVGGVDIATLPLQKLRREIAVIVQTPVLFGGCSIRENLDPFGQYSDDSIHGALTAVQMIDFINDMEYGLDTCVADGGSNFSVGQRQLLCLARSLLGHSRILILDEPTANVDTHTDQLLQKTLKERFSHATIISVAHRLDTVIKYDKILVLGDGKVLEFGPPKDLLLNANGYLSSMVKSTGALMSKTLHHKANS